MAGLECDADFAVGLEAADARAVPGARIHDDEWPQLWIDFGSLRRNDAHKSIVHRPVERASVDDQLGLVVEHVWRGLGQVFAILVSALTHDIPKQYVALRRIDHILHGGSKQTEKPHGDTFLQLISFRQRDVSLRIHCDGPQFPKTLQNSSAGRSIGSVARASKRFWYA